MPNFVILLPPSEGKQPGGNPFAPDMFDYRTSNTFNYFNDLNPQRRKLINALQETIRGGETDLAALFGVQGDVLEEAVSANLELFKGALMATLDRYNPGVMYKAMDFAGLPTGAQRRLLENGIIFSGVFGLLRPDDLIPNYRLKMDATLPEIGRVSTFWKQHISPILNNRVEDKVVWNLLPNIHRDAWDDQRTYRNIVDVRFFDEVDGQRKAVTHNVKTMRGQLVNFIVRETAETVEALEVWQPPDGYLFDPESVLVDEETKAIEVSFVRRG